jgi:hypothetical protein
MVSLTIYLFVLQRIRSAWTTPPVLKTCLFLLSDMDCCPIATEIIGRTNLQCAAIGMHKKPVAYIISMEAPFVPMYVLVFYSRSIGPLDCVYCVAKSVQPFCCIDPIAQRRRVRSPPSPPHRHLVAFSLASPDYIVLKRFDASQNPQVQLFPPIPLKNVHVR